MRKFLLLVAMFLGSISLTMAQGNNSLPNVNLEELKVQNIQLIEQNKMLQTSLDKTQNVYFSALGFAATFLIAFLGINVYFSKSRADEDREVLESFIDKRFAELELAVKEKIQNETQHIEQKVNDLVDVNTKKVAKELKFRITASDSSILGLNLKVACIEFDLADCAGNKMSRAINVIEHSEVLERDWKTADMLTEVRKFLNSGTSFHSTELPEVFRILKSIRESNKQLALKVEQIIVEKHQ